MSVPVNRNAALAVDGWLTRLATRALCRRAAWSAANRARPDAICAAACAEALPWNRGACARCAIPLPRCRAGVDRAARRDAPVCGACLRRPPPLAAVHAAFVYAFPLDRLLPRFKFHDDLAAGRLLAQAAWPMPSRCAATAGCADSGAAAPRPPARTRLRPGAGTGAAAGARAATFRCATARCRASRAHVAAVRTRCARPTPQPARRVRDRVAACAARARRADRRRDDHRRHAARRRRRTAARGREPRRRLGLRASALGRPAERVTEECHSDAVGDCCSLTGIVRCDSRSPLRSG